MRGFVYEIIDKATKGKTIRYIGSTSTPPSKRRANWKQCEKLTAPSTLKTMKHYIAHHGWDSFEMRVLYTDDFASLVDLRKKEQSFINDSCINRKRAIALFAETDKINCPCGRTYVYSGKHSHANTTIHKNWLQLQLQKESNDISTDIDAPPMRLVRGKFKDRLVDELLGSPDGESYLCWIAGTPDFSESHLREYVIANLLPECRMPAGKYKDTPLKTLREEQSQYIDYMLNKGAFPFLAYV